MSQTRAQLRREWQALASVRAAIKGWAFCNPEMLRGRLESGRQAAGGVAPEYQTAAQGLLKPLQDALDREVAPPTTQNC